MSNPYADPNNWRAVFYGENPPNKNLTHGNIVTLEGTGQILMEYIGPDSTSEYVPVLISRSGEVKNGEFNDPKNPRLNEIKGDMQHVAEAQLIFAYNKNTGKLRPLKARLSSFEELIEGV